MKFNCRTFTTISIFLKANINPQNPINNISKSFITNHSCLVYPYLCTYTNLRKSTCKRLLVYTHSLAVPKKYPSLLPSVTAKKNINRIARYFSNPCSLHPFSSAKLRSAHSGIYVYHMKYINFFKFSQRCLATKCKQTRSK